MALFCNFNINIFSGCGVNPFTQMSMPCFNPMSFLNIMPYSNFQMPSFKFDFSNIFQASNNFDFSPKFDFNSSFDSSSLWSNFNFNFTPTSVGDSFSRSIDNSPLKMNGNYLEIPGYNSEKGKKLAQTAWNGRNKERKWSSKYNKYTDFTGYCCQYVKTAIQNAGLGGYPDGHAYQMISKLKSNSSFKQISTSGVDVTKLPPGCIVIYGRGVAGYSSEYGHIEITTGDGRAVSDGVTNHMKQKPTAIFVPV